MAWQVMTREPAQAGNRAGRTEHYLQWSEYNPEIGKHTSELQSHHDLVCRLLLEKKKKKNGKKIKKKKKNTESNTISKEIIIKSKRTE